MREFLITVAVCAAMVAIVPLMIWGGTGSWKHAMHALRSYLWILGGLAVLGGGLGLLMVLADWIG